MMMAAIDGWNIYLKDQIIELLLFQDRLKMLHGQCKNHIDKFGAYYAKIWKE